MNFPEKSFLRVVSIIVTLVATMVMFGWIFDYRPVLNILPGAPTMKAATALAFVLLGLSGCCFAYKLKVSKVIAILVGLVGVLSLSAYLFDQAQVIDSFMGEDSHFSVVRYSMSPATAICFLLTSLGLLIIREKKRGIRLVAQNLWFLVLIVAFISIVTFVLNIQTEEKTEFFSSMAIHTSLLFFFISVALFFQTSDVGFAALIVGPLPGSKMVRQLLPFSIILPPALGYLLYVLASNSGVGIESNFWQIINTLGLTLLSILYISVLALSLNRSSLKQESLRTNLKISNRSLVAFKQAIDRVSMVSIIDEKGCFLEVNRNFVKSTGYQPDELVGEKYSSIHIDEEQFENALEQLRKRDFWEGELECRAKDRTTYWVQSTVVKSNLGETKEARYLVVEYDITAKKVMEQARNTEFVKKLQQKNEELEQFLYIASHDLQEPLRSIRGMIELLGIELSGRLNEVTEGFFQLIDGSATRMSDLIRGLMDYARIGGKKELVKTDLNKLLDEVLQDLKNGLERNNVALKRGGLPHLDVYPVEMRLLFQNLIVNAVKFRRTGVEPRVEINAVEEEHHWKFEVKDNGIGIKERNLDKIFLIFQRLHKQEEFEGTGIGLTHCKKIVTLHNGEIWVESIVDQGSSFFFTISKKQYSIL